MKELIQADRISVSKIARKLDKNGFLKVDGFAAKTGLLVYHVDGKIDRQMVTSEALFSDESINSLTGAPVTIRHSDKLLDMTSAKESSVGAVLSAKQDGDKLAVSLVIHDALAINDIMEGNIELSCGYRAKVEDVGGVIDGVQFDSKQVGRIHNHLAIVDKGRAGSDCKINLDQKGNYMSTEMETLLKVQQDSFKESLDKEVKLNTDLQAKLDESATKAEELAAEIKTLTEQLDGVDAKAEELAVKMIADFEVIKKVNQDAAFIKDGKVTPIHDLKVEALKASGLEVAQDASEATIDGMLAAAVALAKPAGGVSINKDNGTASTEPKLSNRDKWIAEQSKR